MHIYYINLINVYLTGNVSITYIKKTLLIKVIGQVTVPEEHSFYTFVEIGI